MDFMNSKAQKIRNRIYGTIFIVGSIVFFKIFMSFLFDVGYDPSSAIRRSGSLGTVSVYAFGLALISSGVFTVVASLIGAFIEIMFEAKQNSDV